MKLRHRIKTNQQPDTTWKAWTDDAKLVVYAKTKVKAIDIVKMLLEDRGKHQNKTLWPRSRPISKKA